MIKIISRAILLLPIFEIIIFILAGSYLGFFPTLLIFIATTALGVFILRNYQWLVVMRMQQQLRSGYVSTDTMAQDGFMILAGFLLVIPGFITDVIGLLCLIPAIRTGLFKRLLATGFVKETQATNDPEHGPRIIEGEAQRLDNEKP